MIVLRKVILLFLLLKLLFGFDTVNAQDKFFHTSDGVRLHYIEAGEGGTLIFVPGWIVPAEFWQLQIDYFSSPAGSSTKGFFPTWMKLLPGGNVSFHFRSP